MRSPQTGLATIRPGEPIHRGYEPALMSAAPRSDWDRDFTDDQTRLILSINADDDGRIGECQAQFDDRETPALRVLPQIRDRLRPLRQHANPAVRPVACQRLGHRGLDVAHRRQVGRSDLGVGQAVRLDQNLRL